MAELEQPEEGVVPPPADAAPAAPESSPEPQPVQDTPAPSEAAPASPEGQPEASAPAEDPSATQPAAPSPAPETSNASADSTQVVVEAPVPDADPLASIAADLQRVSAERDNVQAAHDRMYAEVNKLQADLDAVRAELVAERAKPSADAVAAELASVQSRLEQTDKDNQQLREQLMHLQNAEPLTATLESAPFVFPAEALAQMKQVFLEALAEHAVAGQVEQAPAEEPPASPFISRAQ